MKITRLHKSSDRIENAHAYIDEQREVGARCILVVAIGDDVNGNTYDFQQFGQCASEERAYAGSLLHSIEMIGTIAKIKETP